MKKILIVDDSRLHHKIYDMVFSLPAMGEVEVIHAMDGREGFALLKAHADLSLVFLDVNMPGMDGLTFLAKRREEKLHPNVPVVIVSSESGEEDRSRGLEAGAAAYLTKPFRPADIKQVIEELPEMQA